MVCELKVEAAAEAAPIIAKLPEGVTAYFELSIDADPSPLAGGRGRAKVRTGGLTPEAFPAPGDLVRFLYRCAKARVPFKATAGLHHPIRSMQRCTYDSDSPIALMHGFVNVFLAASLLWHGGKAGDAIATLEEESPEEFHFDDQAAAWHGHRLRVDQLREARERFAMSFGSCSFEEPIEGGAGAGMGVMRSWVAGAGGSESSLENLPLGGVPAGGRRRRALGRRLGVRFWICGLRRMRVCCRMSWLRRAARSR